MTRTKNTHLFHFSLLPPLLSLPVSLPKPPFPRRILLSIESEMRSRRNHVATLKNWWNIGGNTTCVFDRVTVNNNKWSNDLGLSNATWTRLTLGSFPGKDLKAHDWMLQTSQRHRLWRKAACHPRCRKAGWVHSLFKTFDGLIQPEFSFSHHMPFSLGLHFLNFGLGEQRAIKFDENRLLKKKFKPTPTTPAEARDCAAVLTPKQLLSVVTGKFTFGFTNNQSLFHFHCDSLMWLFHLHLFPLFVPSPRP